MRKLRWLLPLAVLQSAMSMAQSEPSDETYVPEVSDTGLVPIPAEAAKSTRESRGRLARAGQVVRATISSRPRNVRTEGKFVGTVGIRPLSLSRPVDIKLDPSQPMFVPGLPTEIARLDIELEGRSYELFFADEVVEKRAGLRHVTMSVLNEEDSYARFSVDSTGHVYGTLRTPSVTYVFEPDENPGEQAVYRYSANTKRSALDDSRRSIIGRSFIARRHHQIEALALIQPDEVHSNIYSTYVRGGALGSVLQLSNESFKRLGVQLSTLTQFSGAETFELAEVKENLDGSRYARFNQLINGIPIDSPNDMLVNKAGTILQLQASVTPADIHAPKALVTEDEAVRKAVVELEAQSARTIPQITLLSKVRLSYRLMPEADALELAYEFQFEVLEEFGSFHARINAVTGQAEVHSLTRSYTYKSCMDMGAPVPGRPRAPAGNCNSTHPNIVKGYVKPQETGFCQQPPTAQQPNPKCRSEEMVTAYEVLSDFEAIMSAAAATNANPTECCSRVNVMVIKHATAWPNQGPSSGPQNTATSGNAIVVISKHIYSEEVLGHELGHVFSNMYNESGDLNADPGAFARSLHEGGADAIGGLVGAISGRTARYQNKWINGDGSGYPTDTPSTSGYKEEYKYWQHITKDTEEHAGGQVFLWFYRRVQEVSGASDQRMLGLVLGTLTKIRDRDVPKNKLDSNDFKLAVLEQIKPTETALLNAVEAIYREMYRPDAAGPLGPPLPPGTPGPAGSPPITPLVSGVFNSCVPKDGALWTVYDVSWTATANTNVYLGWVKGDTEPAFRYSYQYPAPITAGSLWSTMPSAEGRISSCNANGCSGLSTSRVVVAYRCGG